MLGTEKCFLRTASMNYVVEVRGIVNGKIIVEAGHYLGHQLQKVIQKKLPEIPYNTIHIEPKKEVMID